MWWIPAGKELTYGAIIKTQMAFDDKYAVCGCCHSEECLKTGWCNLASDSISCQCTNKYGFIVVEDKLLPEMVDGSHKNANEAPLSDNGSRKYACAV